MQIIIIIIIKVIVPQFVNSHFSSIYLPPQTLVGHLLPSSTPATAGWKFQTKQQTVNKLQFSKNFENLTHNTNSKL